MLKARELIQTFIDKRGLKTYLEIGVQTGQTFLPIRCRKKIAVDPNFLIPRSWIIKSWIKNPTNLRNEYFTETSDDFFCRRKQFLQRLGKLDIVFVDGMHVYSFALRDVLNALTYLAPDGVIILHDCFPRDEKLAVPLSPQEAMNVQGEWCGDVWKTIVYLKRCMKDSLDVSVLDTDHGLGIIQPRSDCFVKPQMDLAIAEEIDHLTFAQMRLNAKELLGLRRDG